MPIVYARPGVTGVSVWKSIRPWIFPVSCIGCSAPEVALCAACGPVPADATLSIVANTAVAAAGNYDGLLQRAIVAMKRGERAYLDPFARLLAATLTSDVALVPLPTGRRRRAERGFDQAVELARRAARLRGCACCEVLEKRGAAQAGLNRLARLQADGRFTLKAGAPVPPRAVVIDDVWTTGATLNDGILTLRGAGVMVIGGAVLARAAPSRNPHAAPAVMAHGQRSPDAQPARSRPNVKAIWNGAVIAESDATEVVEGNHYFPTDAIKREFFSASSTHTSCPWKGVASYYTVEVAGKRNRDAAWYYPAPKDAAKNISGYVAFWKGVEVTQ